MCAEYNSGTAPHAPYPKWHCFSQPRRPIVIYHIVSRALGDRAVSDGSLWLLLGKPELFRVRRDLTGQIAGTSGKEAKNEIMAKQQSARPARKLPLLLAAAGIAFAIPTAGLAVVSLSDGSAADGSAGAFSIFTPASVDPQLAQRVAQRTDNAAMRFTPAGSAVKRDRTVTVAVRVDQDVARAISVRQALDNAPGGGEGLSTLAATRFNLGTARGYESFARSSATVALPGGIREISMPDLATFEPAGPTAEERPSRFQPRIALEDEQVAGRSPNTLDALGAQTVDLGGAYSITRNLDVTAGVRLSQERERLGPITDSVQDSQAVYVGTQFRF